MADDYYGDLGGEDPLGPSVMVPYQIGPSESTRFRPSLVEAVCKVSSLARRVGCAFAGVCVCV